MKFIFSFVFFLLAPGFISAGTWLSGGGDNLKDAQNPWFLQNTPVVSYCIVVDQDSISGDPENLKSSTRRAIADWLKVFRTYKQEHPTDQLSLGTPNWVEKNCAETVDIYFKFGWSTTTSNERKYLSQNEDSIEHLAVAVRKKYDRVNLRGSGFVYLASDVGPHGLKLEKNQIEKPWQYPTLVYFVLLHELGHVFGLPHLSSALLEFSPRWIMSQYFPEMILQKFFWHNLKKDLVELRYETIASFFDTKIYNNCDITKKIKKWLELPLQTKCITIQFSGPIESPDRVSLIAINDKNQKIHRLELVISTLQGTSVMRGDISVYLPPEQKVFSNSRKDRIPFLMGPGQTELDFAAQVTLPSGVRKNLIIVKQNAYLKISGVDSKSDSIISLSF